MNRCNAGKITWHVLELSLTKKPFNHRLSTSRDLARTPPAYLLDWQFPEIHFLDWKTFLCRIFNYDSLEMKTKVLDAAF